MNTSRNPVHRIYLVGGGVVSRWHAESISWFSEPQNVAISVCDPDPAALKEFKEQFPDARTFPDAKSMLAEPASRADIVVVGTPHFAHAEPTIAGLDSGRHVLCEKPLAMNRGEALQMLEHARANDRLLGCCSNRVLGLETGTLAKRLVQEGRLGQIYHVTWIDRAQRGRMGIEYLPESLGRWALDKSKGGGGPLMHHSPYDFTTLNDILEPVQVDVLCAWMARPTTALDLPPGKVYDIEEHAGASLLYHLPSGARVPVTYERAHCTHGHAQDIVEIEGTEGAVRWDKTGLGWFGGGGVLYSYDRNGKVQHEQFHFGQQPNSICIVCVPLLYFYRHIHGEDAPALINEQAVFNYLIIPAIYDCISTGEPQYVSMKELTEM